MPAKHGLPPNFGYHPDPEHAEARATSSVQLYGADPFADLKCNLNASAFPYRAMAALLANNPRYVRKRGNFLELLARNQSSHGSCVGHGEARKVMGTLCAGYFMRGLELDLGGAMADSQGLVCDVSPSFQYGLSREWDRGSWEGSNGSWAAKATQELGFLFEKNYREVNLSQYSTDDCNAWEARGVPRAALAIADDQVLQGYARIQQWEQMAACLHHGYFPNICGSPAPGRETRDQYGAIALTSRWAHSQCVIAYVVYQLAPRSYLRFFVICNSHGADRYRGPFGAQTPDLPNGAYACTAADMQRIIAGNDTWVNFHKKGLEPAARNWRRLAAKRPGGGHAIAA